jgi:hypothetical protein
MNLQTNSDAERFLLGAVIRDNRPLPPNLAPEDFGEPWLQDVAYAINALKVDGTDLDELTVLDALTKAGSPVTRDAVNGLTNDVGFSAYNAAWAEQVASAASLRRIAALNLRIAKAVADPGTDPAALAAYAEQQLKALEGKPKDAPKTRRPSTSTSTPCSTSTPPPTRPCSSAPTVAGFAKATPSRSSASRAPASPPSPSISPCIGPWASPPSGSSQSDRLGCSSSKGRTISATRASP